MAVKRKTHSIKGRVTKTFFASPAFSAGVLRQDSGQEIRFAGKIMVAEGDRLVLHGHFDKTKFGLQLQVSSYQHDLPTEKTGLAHYLVARFDIRRMEYDLAEIFAEGRKPNIHFAYHSNPDQLINAIAPTLNSGQQEAVLKSLTHRL